MLQFYAGVLRLLGATVIALVVFGVLVVIAGIIADPTVREDFTAAPMSILIVLAGGFGGVVFGAGIGAIGELLNVITQIEKNTRPHLLNN